MRSSDGARIKVFVASAPEDAAFRAVLEKHLSAFERRGFIEVWHEGKVPAGAAPEAEARAHLDEAELVLLLVSPDFAASAWLCDELLVRALERRDRDGARVIPILVRAVEISATRMAELQALPRSGVPIAKAGRGGTEDHDTAWAAVVREIDVVGEREVSKYEVPHRDLDRPNDFVRRVERLCQLREEGASIARCRAPVPFAGLWEIERISDGQVHVVPVAALDRTPTDEALAALDTLLDERYRDEDPHVRSVLVYRGALAPDGLIRGARRHGVELRSFESHNRLVDFRRYVERQTGRLAADPIYPPALYVEQRAEALVGGIKQPIPNAIEDLVDLITAEEPRFVLVLADFGTGKTFLLHEVARRLGADPKSPVVPVLVELRALEKSHSLDALLSQHFAVAGERDVHLDRVFDLLEQGRLVLLFDGFDELALRVSYDRAAEHLDTLMEASRGKAKVVLTSRTTHFLSERDVEQALARRAERLAHRHIVRLAQFDEQQILSFLTKKLGSEAAAQRRFGLLDKVKDLLGLSHNPRMLSFIAEIDEDKLIEAQGRTGTMTAAGLYELLMEKWIGHEFRRAHPRGAPPALDTKGRWRAVIVLAEHLWGSLEKSADLGLLPEDVQRDLRSLGPPEQDAKLTLHQIASGTLLVRDEQGRFSFMHRSVMEFAVAWWAAAHVRVDRPTRLLDACELSPLAAEFFADLASREKAIPWAEEVLGEERSEIAKKNARLVLDRLHVTPVVKVVLRGQDLRGQDFSDKDLRRADFRGSDLSEATFAGSNLEGAVFANAVLVRASLLKAKLAGADLCGADLSFAQLSGADLRGAKLDGAVLRYAKLVSARLDPDALAGLDAFGAALLAGDATKGVRADPLTIVEPMMLGGVSECYALAASPDGQILAVGYGTGHIALWDVASGAPVRAWVDQAAPVDTMVFAPDARTLVTGARDGILRLWHVASGQCIRSFRGHHARITRVAIAPDGSTLASAAADGTVHLWAWDSDRLLRSFAGHRSAAWSIAFAPDGETFATAGEDRKVRLWDPRSGELLRTMAHEEPVWRIAFDPDGKTLATGTVDDTLGLWEVSSGRLVQSLALPGGVGVTDVAFAPDAQTIAVRCTDRGVWVWRLARHPVAVLGEALPVTGDAMESIAFVDRGKMLATCHLGERVDVSDISSGRTVRSLSPLSSGEPHSVAFSPDGETLAAGGGHIQLWGVRSGQLLRSAGHSAHAHHIAFAPDGETLAACLVTRVYLFEPNSGEHLRILDGHREVVWSVAFSPDGQTVATGSEDGTARLWETRTARPLRTLRPPEGPLIAIQSVAFAPDGKTLITGANDGTVRLWEPKEDKLLHAFKGHSSLETGRRAIKSVAFAPDGQMFATASEDATARLWDAKSGQPLRSLKGHERAVTSVLFAPDGKTLATCSDDRTVRLWEPGSGQFIRSLGGHAQPLTSVAFSPDGRTLATGSMDGTVRLWEVATGRALAALLETPHGRVAFTPDGRYKFSGDLGGSFWHVMGLCRFEPGELDEWIPGLRLKDDEPLYTL